MKTHVYIDGFNLYYGRLKGTQYKWLNIEALCDALLPNNQIAKIYYFTAKVDARPNDLDQPVRQMAYLRALSTLQRVEVHYGSFLTSVVRQPIVETDAQTGRWQMQANAPKLKTDTNGAAVKDWILKTEEKGSDVNLASFLLRDAFRQSCSCAVIVSNDSDLLTPIGMAKNDCGLTIGLIPPRAKGSLELKRLADFKVDPRVHYLAGAQLPSKLADKHGTIQKPSSW